MNERIKTIQYLSAHVKNYLQFTYAVYDIISIAPEEEKWLLFKEFILNYKRGETDQTLDIYINYPPELAIKGHTLYWDAIHNYVCSLIDENPDESVFYKSLWDYISIDIDASDSRMRPLAMMVCGLDWLLPYSQIDLTNTYCLDKHTYYQQLNELQSFVLPKVDALMRYPFENRTERAGEILKLLDSFPDFETKLVLMSYIIRNADEEDELYIDLINHETDGIV